MQTWLARTKDLVNKYRPDLLYFDGGAPFGEIGLEIPNYANWADGKWIIEGTDVSPDVTVEQDQTAVLEGRDPQLDRAIAYLKEQIAAKPVPRPSPPPFPVKIKK